MNPIHAKLLSYLIDWDGRLDPSYARRIFLNTAITPLFFHEYVPSQNYLKPTAASMIFEFARNYYLDYQRPTPATTFGIDIIDTSTLSYDEKNKVYEDFAALQHFRPNENEFDYIIDALIVEYINMRALEFMTTGTKTLKENPISGVEFLVDHLAPLLNIQRMDEDAIDKTLTLSQFSDYLTEELERTGAIMQGTVPYPYPEANRLLGGMAPGELVVIAGPSNAGKSFIGHDIAYFTALINGMPVVCADREMLHPQNGLRFLSRQTQVPSRKLRNEKYRTPAEDRLLRAALDEFRSIQAEEDPILFIPPMRCANTNMIKHEITRMWGDRKPKLIIADYLTEFEPTRRREGWEEVKQITHDLKQLALYYACPVVTMAQINRRGEVQYATIRHICDTLIILEEDQQQPYTPPKADEFVGIPGIIHCVVDKSRNEAKNVQFSLEVEFATASVKGLAAPARTVIGANMARSPYDQDISDIGVQAGD